MVATGRPVIGSLERLLTFLASRSGCFGKLKLWEPIARAEMSAACDKDKWPRQTSWAGFSQWNYTTSASHFPKSSEPHMSSGTICFLSNVRQNSMALKIRISCLGCLRYGASIAHIHPGSSYWTSCQYHPMPIAISLIP